MDDNLYLKRGAARKRHWPVRSVSRRKSWRPTCTIARSLRVIPAVTALCFFRPRIRPKAAKSNTLAVAADLSEASLGDLAVQISNAVDARGLKIGLMGKKVIVPTALQFRKSRAS